MKKIAGFLIALSMVLIFVMSSFAQSFRGGNIPAPMLLSPVEKADLSGKDSLKFKWSSATMDIDRLEFKLLKGGIGSAQLLLEEDVSSAASSLEVKAELFEEGQSYTWQVRAVSDEGYKSDWAFDSFTVTKK